MSAGLLHVRLALGFPGALAVQPEPPSHPGTPPAGQAAIVPQLFHSHRPCLQVASRDQPEGFRGHRRDQSGKGWVIPLQLGPSRLRDITQDWALSSPSAGLHHGGAEPELTAGGYARPSPDVGTELKRGWLPVCVWGGDRVSNVCTVPFPKGARLLRVRYFRHRGASRAPVPEEVGRCVLSGPRVPASGCGQLARCRVSLTRCDLTRPGALEQQ